MKTKFASVLFVLGVLLTARSSAEPVRLFFNSVTADAQYTQQSCDDIQLRVGASRYEVLAKIGRPGIKLIDDAWAYLDVQMESTTSQISGDLVVSFREGRVAAMHIVKRAKLDVLVADARRDPRGFSVTRALLASAR